MNGGSVIWSSKLMKVAATSSSEAEIIAAVESVKTAVHFRALLEELGLCKVKHIDVLRRQFVMSYVSRESPMS